MMQPLRRSNLLIWIVLSTLLAALFAAGVISRRPTMPNNPNVNWKFYK